MGKLVEDNDESFQAILSRYRFRRHRGQLLEAEADLVKAQCSLPVSLPCSSLQPSGAAQGDLAKARGLLRQGLSQAPRDPVMVKALAGLEIRAGKQADAVALLQRAVQEMPAALELQVLLTDLLIDQGESAQAVRKLDELEKAGTTPALLDYLHGRVAVQQARWTEALAHLEKAGADLGTKTDWAGRIHALLGLCYKQVGDVEQELAAFRLAVAQEPNWTLARFGLGSALVDNGLWAEAQVELQLVQNAADAPPEVWTVLAHALIFGHLSRPEQQRTWSEVDKVLAKATALTPQAAELPWLQAEVPGSEKGIS